MALQDPIAEGAIWRRVLTGATQAEGDQVLTADANTYERSGVQGRYRWALQMENDGTQTTGTLTVLGRVPGAPSYQETIGTIDMNAPTPLHWEGVYAGVKVSPASYDGTDYDVYLVAMDG